MKYTMKVSSQKGSTFVTVIVVLGILLILAVALIEGSTSGYKLSKHEETVELAYRAGESAVEHSFSYLSKYCSDPNAGNGISFTTDEDFVNKVISEKIVPTIVTGSSITSPSSITTSGSSINYKIAVTGNAGDVANINVSLTCKSVAPVFGDPNTVTTTIGAIVTCNYSRGSDRAINRTIYAQKNVKINIPRRFTLQGSIYSMGDFMVENISASVTGDTFTYGTSPVKSAQNEQYYYGGVYAKNNGHLSIFGNAYSRGMIRAGQYSNVVDNGSIYVYKDAIANGIQIFGNTNRIFVGRNAFTFDDLEMNGENSIIAVNGSYIGLTNSPGATDHDQSSAVINSAVVHNASTDASKLSRIVINGDVIISGGTFRVNPDGSFIPDAMGSPTQIEDASVISSNTVDKPMYRLWQDAGSPSTYHKWLYANKNDATGYANIIQYWPVSNYTSDYAVNTWMGQITSTSAITTGGIGTNNLTSPTIVKDISGYSSYEVGANNLVYFRKDWVNNIDLVPSSYSSGIHTFKPLEHLNNTFTLDNTLQPSSYWSSFWNWVSGIANWNSDINYSYSPTNKGPLINSLEILSNTLVNLTQVFGKREVSGGNITNTFNLGPSLSGSAISLNKFTYAIESLKLKEADMINTNITGAACMLDVEKFRPGVTSASSISVNINQLLNERMADTAVYPTMSRDKYFVIYNSNPYIELTVGGTGSTGDQFNGIIYSAGRIVVNQGASVNGAIIAGGSWFDVNDPNVKFPQVNATGTNLGDLDSGKNAGVYFRGTSPSDTATVVFTTRDDLLNKFKRSENGDLDLTNIF